jgi:peptidoglycan hydrolase-like protein with peptidoglycan-binding domain
MSNREDFDAIKDFFTRTTSKTLKGGDIKTSFLQWAPTVPSIVGTVSDENLTKTKGFRDSFNATEFPKEVATIGTHPKATAEELEFYANMPIVNTTGMSATQAKAAVQAAALTAPKPPASLSMFQATPTTAVNEVTGTVVVDAGDPKTWLKKGSSGKGVLALQKLLGFTGKALDSKFGKDTEAKVKAWQTGHGLPATGIVDGVTANKMSGVMNADGTPAPTGAAAIAALTGVNTVKPAVAAASPTLKPTMAAVTTGATTAKPSTAFQAAVQSASTAATQAGILPAVKSLPGWAWGGLIGGTLAAIAYAIFGKPKMKIYGRRSRYDED